MRESACGVVCESSCFPSPCYPPQDLLSLGWNPAFEGRAPWAYRTHHPWSLPLPWCVIVSGGQHICTTVFEELCCVGSSWDHCLETPHIAHLDPVPAHLPPAATSSTRFPEPKAVSLQVSPDTALPPECKVSLCSWHCLVCGWFWLIHQHHTPEHNHTPV